MSRIKIAVMIALLVFVLGAGGHMAVHAITASAQSQLQSIRLAAQEQDYALATQRIIALTDYYKAKQHWLEFFMKRENVTSVSINLHGLAAYANAETHSDLLSEIDKAQEQLSMLEHLFASIF